MSEISASILDCNFDELDIEIKKINESGVKYIHIDIMDGFFVERNTESLFDLDMISNLSDKYFDIHLMVDNPIDSIEKYFSYNPKYISIHIESKSNITSCINKIKSNGIGAGIAINPDTKLSELEPYLEDIDLVLVMSVHPGLGGQKFIETTYQKIKELNKLRDTHEFKISVDGGVNQSNSSSLLKYGSDILVSGSFLMKNTNLNFPIKSLLNR